MTPLVPTKSVVLIGSTNKVKIEAVRKGFNAFAPGKYFLVGEETESDVPKHPRNNEIARGALNRMTRLLSRAKHYGLQSDSFLVTIEAGTYDQPTNDDPTDNYYLGGEIIVASYPEIKVRQASLQRLLLPKNFKETLKNNLNLEEAMHRLTGITEAGKKEGIVGYLTNGAITRRDYIANALTLLLPEFLHQEYAK